MKVKSESKYCDYVFNLQTIKKIILLGGVKVLFLYFKQLLLNIKQKFESLCHLIDGERLLSVAVSVVTFSVDKPLDFHGTNFSVVFLKCNKTVEVLSKVVLHH